MKDRIKDFLKVLLMVSIGVACVLIGTMSDKKPKEIKRDIIIKAPPNRIENYTAKEGLMKALILYDVKHHEIVYAQAILETGNFKSKGCTEHNNLFGLYDSKNNRYHKFNHWTESVKGYKNWIQRKYKPPEDYYQFLQRIGYASDPHYIKKLKTIMKKENDKRRYTKGDSLS